ncbi:MAG: aminotransferase class V-fold PLP-dependent enzyme, partial [Longimicrobiales bacterium]
GVEVRVVESSAAGELDAEALALALDGARLLVLNHVSNVLGTALPVAELASAAHRAGALVLLDAAQSAGHVPLDVGALDVDMVAITGHKGLLGPQGTGALWVRAGVDVEPLLRGGAGGDSWLEDMPAALPDRLEAGTLNGPGIAGWLAALEWLAGEDVAVVHRRLADLKADLRAGLEAVPGVRVLSPPAPDGAAIVTIDVQGFDPAVLATRLDREHGVLTRPGLHCAPEAHAVIGTARRGAVRFSLGWASERRDVERAIEAVRTVVAGAGRAGPATAAMSHRT